MALNFCDNKLEKFKKKKNNPSRSEGKGNPRWTFLETRFIQYKSILELLNNHSLFTVLTSPYRFFT